MIHRNIFSFIRTLLWKDQAIDFSYFPSLLRVASALKHIEKNHLTPIFIADERVIRERFHSAGKAIRMKWKKSYIAFSFKTNYALVSSLFDIGARAEVTSERELRLALHVGYDGSHIIFNGPYKSLKALELAWVHHVLVQVDNIKELETISKLSKRMTSPLRFGCRIQLSGKGIPETHFGIRVSELFDEKTLALLRSNPRMKFEGIHIHIGSDVGSVRVVKEAATRIGTIVEQLSHKGIPIRYLNVGGGMTSHGLKPYDNTEWAPYDFTQYIQALRDGINGSYSSAGELEMVFEPGRYLVDDSTLFVTRVLRVAHGSNIQTIHVDGTTAMLPLSLYRPQIIRVYSPNEKIGQTRSRKLTIIYGASCREIDVLYYGPLQEVTEGDTLLFYCVGAYNQTLGSDFIFPKPDTMVITDHGRHIVPHFPSS